jgi:hypothetical protein
MLLLKLAIDCYQEEIKVSFGRHWVRAFYRSIYFMEW